MGLLHDYFGNFSTRGERYYFTWGEIEPTQGKIETNIRKLGKRRKIQISFSGGGDLWWGSWHGDGVPDMGMGFQTWGWGSRHMDGVPDMGMGFQTWRWGSLHVMRFQTWGWGSWHGMGFQTRGGVPDMGWGSRHGSEGQTLSFKYSKPEQWIFFKLRQAILMIIADNLLTTMIYFIPSSEYTKPQMATGVVRHAFFPIDLICEYH